MLDFGFATCDEIAQELGSRLRAGRLALNVSQAELAQRAGISVGTVKNLETKGQSSVLSLLRVVQALGLTDELSPLFVPSKPKSIAQMEQLEGAQRQRASRSHPESV